MCSCKRVEVVLRKIWRTVRIRNKKTRGWEKNSEEETMGLKKSIVLIFLIL
jgi:hypothetical protein